MYAIASLPLESPSITEGKVQIEPMDGHAVVAQCLKHLGVTHAFCISGTPIRETLAYCAKVGIRPIGVRNQQAGVMMAIAQNYISGRLTAISILSAGPAVTNAATSILVARDNCWPVVVLGGRRPLNMQGMGSFQELDAVPVFESITKWSAVVESTGALPEYLQRAFRVAVSGRPGPVYLDLPEDVLFGMVSSYEPPSMIDVEFPDPDADAISRGAAFLLEAKRPAMIIGKGVRWSEPYEELTRLVDEYGIPFITSPMGRGYLPDDHPLCCNDAHHLMQSTADAVLVVGARLNWTFRFGAELARDAKIIQIDVHEQEIGVNVTPAVGIVGDAKEVLSRLLSKLDAGRSSITRHTLAAWHAMLNKAVKQKQSDYDSLMSETSLPMSPYRMLKEIREFLPRDAICVFDGNVFMAAAQQVVPSYHPASRFTAGSNGCMGVGIPFGIGAKLSEPNRPVIIICGDAAFGFNAMDMETAVRHRIPIVVVVVNNDGVNGALSQKLFPEDFERVTMFQPGIRYDAISNAFGGYGEFVGSPEQIMPALRRASDSGLPACINIRVDPNAPYPRE